METELSFGQTTFLLWVPPFLSYELWKLRIELWKHLVQTTPKCSIPSPKSYSRCEFILLFWIVIFLVWILVFSAYAGITNGHFWFLSTRYDQSLLLHGQQYIELYRPFPSSGCVRLLTRTY